VGGALWTVVSSYPDPSVLYRNLARYRRLPVDPEVEERMGWQLSALPGDIELFVDSLLVPTPDWRVYRVPWYVPTPLEAAESLHGDCEAKAVLLASLLAGKGIPYEFRASFNHIWVDYPGRTPRPGESSDIAYLAGQPGRLRLRWPDRVAWGEFLTVQREQLWSAMPLARKALWALGLLWVASAALVLAGAKVEGDFASSAGVRARQYLARAAWASMAAFVAVVLVPSLLPRTAPLRWTHADLWEVLALSAFTGAFIAWLGILRPRAAVTVASDGLSLTASSSLGVWGSAERHDTADVRHIELEASPSGPHPWTIRAALRTGERVPLLRCREELTARMALRRLGLALTKPLLVISDGHSYWTMPDEIERNLAGRMARRPSPPSSEKPHGCLLEVTESEGRWRLGHRSADQRPGLALLGFASVPAIFVALATQAVLSFPRHILVWVVWMLAVSLLSLTIYLAIILRSEIMGVLAGAHIEITDGELRFHTPGRRVESVELSRIQSIELARRGEEPVLAIVSDDRVIHLRGLCAPEHRVWLGEVIEGAVARAG
jgi:hypothetical protein